MERHAMSRIRALVQGVAALLLVLAVPAGLSAGQLVGDTSPKLQGAGLISELQKGGYVIYFRHGITSEQGEKDVTGADLDDCSKQRPLSDAGHAQTKEIGAAFKALKIPAGEVYSSPYCRCLDTARNIFGKATKADYLHFAVHLRTAERGGVTAKLLDMLAKVPAAGTNTALVSHTANLQEAVGIWPKPEGVAHVFKPKGDGTFTYVGIVQPETWVAEAKKTGGFASPGWFDWLKGR